MSRIPKLPLVLSASLSLFSLLFVPLACDGESAPPCQPSTCQDLALDCGVWDDGCGNELDCGDCAQGFCNENGRCVQQWTEMLERPDGVRLRSQVYLPEDMDGPVPALVFRTPYRSDDMQFYYDGLAQVFNERGYAMLLQDCRGTHGSEGEWVPFLKAHEVADGKAAVAWAREQAWCNGRVGTLGTSYEGFTAIAAAVDDPEVDFVLADGPGEGLTFYNEGGVLCTGMMFYQAAINNLDELSTSISIDCTNALDLDGLDMELLGEEVSSWRDALAHPSPADAFWDDSSLRRDGSRLCAPMLITHGASFGWDHPDRMVRALRSESCAEHREHIWYVVGSAFDHGGALSHVYYGLDSPLSRSVFALMDHFMKDEPFDEDSLPRNRLWSAGDDAPFSLDEWPPPAGDELLLYPLAEQGLGGDPGAAGEVGGLDVDPENRDPCDAEQVDYTWWYSDPLDQEVLVGGRPRLEFRVSGTGADMDWFWTLLAWDPWAPEAEAYRTIGMGRWRARYREGLDREVALPDDTPVLMDLELSTTAHRFREGQSVLLLLQGNMCAYVENPHTAEPLDAQTHYRTSAHRLHQLEGQPSVLHLPVVQRVDGRRRLTADLPAPEPRRALDEALRAWAERDLGL